MSVEQLHGLERIEMLLIGIIRDRRERDKVLSQAQSALNELALWQELTEPNAAGQRHCKSCGAMREQESRPLPTDRSQYECAIGGGPTSDPRCCGDPRNCPYDPPGLRG